MDKSIFSCYDLSISHEQLVQLQQDGHLNLGIDNSVAAQISGNPSLKPTKQAVSAAFHFWNWVGFGVLGYSIYLSFTSDWWWFIPGLFLLSIIWKVNKKSNTENILAAAFVDAEFYEKIRDVGGWIYQLEDSRPKNTRKQPRPNSLLDPKCWQHLQFREFQGHLT